MPNDGLSALQQAFAGKSEKLAVGVASGTKTRTGVNRSCDDLYHLGGRKLISVYDSRAVTAEALHADKKMPVMDICRTLNVSRPTLYRWLALN